MCECMVHGVGACLYEIGSLNDLTYSIIEIKYMYKKQIEKNLMTTNYNQPCAAYKPQLKSEVKQ